MTKSRIVFPSYLQQQFQLGYDDDYYIPNNFELNYLQK